MRSFEFAYQMKNFGSVFAIAERVLEINLKREECADIFARKADPQRLEIYSRKVFRLPHYK
ncbi:hypothetical protein CH375_15605 [Leptospira ellisii]|uniref:Uncharacterized protein n=1 Tax=Leptospira ellisii TaxID=2023197 RepID=A0A2N0BIF4_9LEPT|nr:hypothetical protein CH379_11545 [Leptospira ellisii]PKA03668.1 hypothetical protein CH375_15605 [Leptospira ellisii]